MQCTGECMLSRQCMHVRECSVRRYMWVRSYASFLLYFLNVLNFTLRMPSFIKLLYMMMHCIRARIQRLQHTVQHECTHQHEHYTYRMLLQHARAEMQHDIEFCLNRYLNKPTACILHSDAWRLRFPHLFKGLRTVSSYEPSCTTGRHAFHH